MNNLIDGPKNRMYIFQDQISKLEDGVEYFLAGYSTKNKKKRKHERRVKQHKRSIGSNLLTEVSEAVN